MGNDGGFMTAKAISKRIKAKGLGRLRWYCQMCEKQCRDENGFKCHTQSAGHQRQLAVFAETPNEFISSFSLTFRNDFLSVVRQRYPNTMVHANTVYQEYIKDRHHIHMNATQWTTLSDFVKDLGKQGFCKVEDREDGFWLSFVDRQIAERDKQARERDTLLLQEEHRSEQLLQRQIRQAKSSSIFLDEEELAPEFQKVSTAAHSTPFKMRLPSSNNTRPSMALSSDFNALQSLSNTRPTDSTSHPNPSTSASKPLPLPPLSLPNGNNENEEVAEEENPPWLLTNIIVKVKNKDIGDGSFFGKKGKVVKVIDDYGARVSMLDSGSILELDQDDLESVIPKAGGVVLLLRGVRRGQKATIKSINVDDFSVTVSTVEGGEQLENVDYEMVSRLST